MAPYPKAHKVASTMVGTSNPQIGVSAIAPAILPKYQFK
jgi:hypothetical protein